jgi:putative ABC transport system permease protein
MMIRTTLVMALKSLTSNPLRTGLSMLGIIIGVAAVIAMLALGAGAQKQVMDNITAMGTRLLVVRPGQQGVRGVAQEDEQTLRLSDARFVMQQVSAIQQAAPVVNGSVQVKYFNRNARSTLTGTTRTYFSIRNFSVGSGRFFSEAESESLNKVAVIGSDLASTLFGKNTAVGEPIKINGVNFHVVGVLTSKGDQGFFNPDNQVFVPYGTAMKQVLGVDTLREIDLQVAENDDLFVAQENATQALRRRHRIMPAMEDDFYIRNQAEFIETANTFTQTFTVLLGGIAGISLLVGGIGIMNIMLVTVTERTREIGIRKALGAKERDVLFQFLLESLFFSGLGGCVGVLVGIVGAVAIGWVAKFPALLQPYSIVLSLGFAMGIGIFFGFYPALKAARLNPIEALRYE